MVGDPPMQFLIPGGFFCISTYVLQNTHHKKKDGTIFVDPSPYTINLLIAYDENTLYFNVIITQNPQNIHNLICDESLFCDNIEYYTVK